MNNLFISIIEPHLSYQSKLTDKAFHWFTPWNTDRLPSLKYKYKYVKKKGEKLQIESNI